MASRITKRIVWFKLEPSFEPRHRRLCLPWHGRSYGTIYYDLCISKKNR